MNFIPDSGKYEIVSFICTCHGKVNSNTPLQRVAVEVVGWTREDEFAADLEGRGLLPLLPVVLTLDGLTTRGILPESKVTFGAPRLAKIGECTLTHAELTNLHRAYHEQD